MFDGFDYSDVAVDGANIRVASGGDGPPVLLLHGYPQTHVMWHPIASELAKSYRVIATDLRGYGASTATDGDYTFRAMARDQVAVMSALGFDRFHVVSHDRGARTAHRMVLDWPAQVASLVLMDILPTLDVWRTMDAFLARAYFHWTFLAQPGDMPAALINSDPLRFMNATLLGLSGNRDLFHPRALAAYEDAARNPDVVAAWCGDYRAGATTDLDHDRADLGRTSDIPCLVLWGEKGVVAHHVDPLATWQNWFPRAMGHAIPAGHFLVEEQPDAVCDAVLKHLKTVT